MEKILVRGGARLCGQTYISGMKNSALPVIFATLLIEDECVIHNVPRVSDIENAIKILVKMGATAYFASEHTLIINCKAVKGNPSEHSLISKMRASSYLMGAMLARFGECKIPLPGGCNFGKRPIDTHLMGFSMLGADCYEGEELISLKSTKTLKSGKIPLDKISVGATINMVLASVFLEGETEIHNVAREPHVDDLISFLNNAGANIKRSGEKIVVKGVKKLHGCEYRIFPDMIEALTFMTYLGATGGEILLVGTENSHLEYVNRIFLGMNFDIKSYKNRLYVKSNEIFGTSVTTAPYPFFPTDLHSQFAAMLCYANGGGSVREDVFPNRFAYINELKKMGAKIKLSGNRVDVSQGELNGASLDATDLRAGAALICASLGASGESTINNVNYIVRGYENVVEKVASLGGKIKYIKGE